MQDWKSTVQDWKSVRLAECKVGRVQGWKSARLEECKIGRLQDWKRARLEKCKVGRVRLEECKKKKVEKSSKKVGFQLTNFQQIFW